MSFAHTFNDGGARHAQEGAVLRDDRVARAVGRRLEGGGRAAAGRSADRGDARRAEVGALPRRARLLRVRRPRATPSRRSSRSSSSAGGPRPASTTCCRSTRACSCAWASASRAPCQPATGYVFYPGGAPQFEYTAVNVKNRSHTITAEVEIPDGGAEGVLLAHGSWFAGYSLYVKDRPPRATCTTTWAWRSTASTRPSDRAVGPAHACVPLHAHGSRIAAAGTLRIDGSAGRRGRDPAHGAARDRDLGRGPLLRLRQRPAGDRRTTARRSGSPGASSRSWSSSTRRTLRPTATRSCALR